MRAIQMLYALSMDTLSTAQQLAKLDAPDLWVEFSSGIPKEKRAETFSLAGRLWLQRIAQEGMLLVNPKILKELEAQNWEANDLQKRMIWASVLANLEGASSKERFKEIKGYLLKKHGREWWEDVYSRKDKAWIAKEWIRKRTGSLGSAVSALAEKTILFGNVVAQERLNALSSIPEN